MGNPLKWYTHLPIVKHKSHFKPKPRVKGPDEEKKPLVCPSTEDYLPESAPE